MARELFPVSRTGAVGQEVWQRNRQGTAIRARVQPLNPETNYQNAARQRLVALASAWRGLTQAVRDAWASFAIQLPGSLSGFNAYMTLNNVLVSCGESVLATPPQLPAFGIMTCAGVDGEVTGGVFALDLGVTTNTVAPTLYEIWATPFASQGIANANASYRFLRTITPAEATAGIDLAASYIGRFGQPAVGDALSIKVIPMKTGVKNVGLSYRPIVVAGT